MKKQDQQRVNGQVTQNNFDYVVQEVGLAPLLRLFGNGGPLLPGHSNFEGHELNDMLDLVEHANPEHLESAGKTLFDARDAIKKAASELNTHITQVDWEGEGAKAFHTWGGNLVSKSDQLATFAETAGTQITSAGSGLASVRGSMPPRDTRLNRKKVKDIPLPEQVEGNSEYDAAVKVEEHRQEAINQMNRLASFYKVSESNMAAQEPPMFDAMPDMGVPKPTHSYDDGGGGGRNNGSSSGRNTPVVTKFSSNDEGSFDATSKTSRATSHGVVVDPSAHSVNTEIDSVDAPPVPTQTQAIGPHHTPAGNPPPVSTPPPPPVGPPVSTTGRRFSTGPEGRTPTNTGRTLPPRRVSNTGESENVGRQTSQARQMGRAINSMGRMGQNPSRDQTSQARQMGRAINSMGRVAQNNSKNVSNPGRGSSTTGRPVSGGKPRQTNTSNQSRTSATGAPKRTNPPGRPGGVVGGKPNTPTHGTPAAKVPKGKVVGADNEAVNRASRPGSTSNRGVIGAQRPAGENRRQMPPRPDGSSEGVTGSPKGRLPGSRGGARGGFTPGGSGLVRDSWLEVSYEEGYEDHHQQEFQGDTTPDSDTGDVEQRRPEQRRDVPPPTD
ncbi:WXG100 family type VII secretion target [Streptomyces sp. NPDC050560]|uniref:WXG100 family type VII secretion target n=1 Tax=Streptomyces sp. NPDC050560 TaxID=3365630 RepID=UPI0037A22CDF